MRSGVSRCLDQGSAHLFGDPFRRETGNRGRPRWAHELEGGGQLVRVSLPETLCAALQLVQSGDERPEVSAHDVRAHSGFGPGVVRIINPVAPPVAHARRDQKDLAARVARDGRVWRGVADGLKARRAEQLWRERDDRETSVSILFNVRLSALKALNSSRYAPPGVAPEPLVIIRPRNHALDFRQHQRIRARVVLDPLTREMIGKGRAGLFTSGDLIGALYDDAGPDARLRSVFGKVTGLGGGDQAFTQGERAFAVEHRPDGQHAVGIEMIIGDKLYALRQFDTDGVLSVWTM